MTSKRTVGAVVVLLLRIGAILLALGAYPFYAALSGHGANIILWRLAGFCDVTAHQKDDVCTSPNAAAVTTVWAGFMPAR